MFVVIYEPSTNETLYQRRLGPYERMDLDKFKAVIEDIYEVEIDEPNGHIPSCSGDIRIEFRPRRDDDVCIWSGQSFFFKRA